MLRKLRNRKPVNYYEAEEPAHDAYEFCEHCNDFVEEFCTSHGGLLVIPDDKVPTGKSRLALPRAMLTVPAAFLYIDSSSIPGAGLGVFARVTIPLGARFGPYIGCKRHPSQTISDYAWQISVGGVRSHVCDGVDASRSNWMRYVNCARHSLEQNIIGYQYHGQIYYRTSKIITAGRELLVFYGTEFAAKLNIDLANYNKIPPLARTMGNTSDKQDTDMGNAQNNLADSLNATSAELRRVNECLGAVDLEQSDGREMDFLSMLKSFNDEGINVEPTDEPNVSLSANVSLINKQENNKNADSNKTELINNKDTQNENADINVTKNRESKEKCDSKACKRENYKQLSRNQLRFNKVIGLPDDLDDSLSAYLALVNNNEERSKDNNEYIKMTQRYEWQCKQFKEVSKPREELFQSKDKDINKDDETTQNKLQRKVCPEVFTPTEALRQTTEKNIMNKDNETTQLHKWQCKVCLEVFKSRETLRRHKRNHENALRFKCEMCDYRTNELFYFERHKKSSHRVAAKVFKCDRCNFSCVNLKAFKSHCALHGKAAAKCDLCGYMSDRAWDVRAHFSRAHAPFRSNCDICGRVFSCDQYLRRHIKAQHEMA